MQPQDTDCSLTACRIEILLNANKHLVEESAGWVKQVVVKNITPGNLQLLTDLKFMFSNQLSRWLRLHIEGRTVGSVSILISLQHIMISNLLITIHCSVQYSIDALLNL